MAKPGSPTKRTIRPGRKMFMGRASWQGKKLFEPLYTKEDAYQTLERFHAIDYDHPFRPIPGVTVRFRDAGHILGSAIVVVDVQEDEAAPE